MALAQVGRFVVTESDGTTQINLYPSAEVALPDRGMRVEISSDFPRLTNTRIRVECQKAQTYSLALRIPPPGLAQ